MANSFFLTLLLVSALLHNLFLPFFILSSETYSEEKYTQSTTIQNQNSEPFLKWTGDYFENFGRVYKNDDNEFLQELWLLGRYHGQYYWARGSNGDDNDYEARRVRFGTQAKLTDALSFHAQAISGSDFVPAYNGFSELWLKWEFSKQITLTVGQQKHRFTHDRNVSSRYINYLERSMLTNMFGADYTPAVTLLGTVGDTAYYTGLFSNATGKNVGEAFSDFDSGYSFITAAYHNLHGLWGTDSSYLHGTYVHSDANSNATNLDVFNNGISTALILTKGSKSFVSEFTTGFGSESGNVYGINLQPGVFLTNRIQLVGRYQLAFSNEEQGLSPQRRYEQEVKLPDGDQYQAGYVGVNYYLAKHRLKLMQGVEYAHMGDDHAWTFSCMVRFFFGPHTSGAFPMNQMLPGEFWAYD